VAGRARNRLLDLEQSRGLMLLADGFRFAEYRTGESDEALGLEARSPQGRTFRLSFDRSYFHRRAENFRRWRLVTARRNGALVGIAGAAIKEVQLDGRPTKALYHFDVRVAPEERRTRVAQRLIDLSNEWGSEQSAEFGYGYVAGDNAAAAALTQQLFGAAASGGWRCLVYPLFGSGASAPKIEVASAADVRASYLEHSPSFGLICGPEETFGSEALVGSWLLRARGQAGGCSAWDNKGIMGEVVERLPLPLQVGGVLTRLGRSLGLALPAIPRRGEKVRSWYLFDLHASGAEVAAELINTVAAAARLRRIDYLYLIHQGDELWVEPLRRRLPRLFAPVIPYSIVGREVRSRTPVVIHRPLVDIRDV
jgi:hypothetical protein